MAQYAPVWCKVLAALVFGRKHCAEAKHNSEDKEPHSNKPTKTQQMEGIVSLQEEPVARRPRRSAAGGGAEGKKDHIYNNS